MTGPETAARPCAVCGGSVTARPRGRPSVYCSRACQAKAYRARKDGRPLPSGPATAAGDAGRAVPVGAAGLASLPAVELGTVPTPPEITDGAVRRRMGKAAWVPGKKTGAWTAAHISEAVTLAGGRIDAGQADQRTADLIAYAADQLGILAVMHRTRGRRDETPATVTETGTGRVGPAGERRGDGTAPEAVFLTPEPQNVTKTGADTTTPAAAGQDIDRDELFDALEDLVGLDRTALPAELAEALTLPIVALASALAGASGDGPVDELVAAGRDVVDAVADYRQMPAAAGLVRLVDRLAAALPAPATGRDENQERDENLAHRPAAPGQSAPAEPAPAVDDDTAAYDREQAEQRRRFEAALKPVPEVGAGVLMAEWPGSGRYYLVEATTGERIGYAEKKAYSSVWEARTMRGSKVPATTTYKTRRQALVQVALHHQETTQQTRRTRRTRSR